MKRLSALLAPTILLLGSTSQGAIITLTNFQAVMSPTVNPASGLVESVSLLVDSRRFGPGGLAGGLAAVGTNPPDGSIWLVDPSFANPPGDGMSAIGFDLNPAGEVMGIDPEPFHVFLGTPSDDGPTLIGWLDFSEVSGSLGSLNLSGVVVHAVDPLGNPTGVIHTVAPFTVQAVPEPSTLAIFAIGIIGFAMVSGWRRRKNNRA